MQNKFLIGGVQVQLFIKIQVRAVTTIVTVVLKKQNGMSLLLAGVHPSPVLYISVLYWDVIESVGLFIFNMIVFLEEFFLI